MSDEPDPQRVLTFAQVQEAGLDDWRMLFSTLHARFRTGDFTTGARLVAGIAQAADRADHHPDVDLTYPRVDVRLSSHDAGGVTSRDLALARRISALAADLGATPAPGELSVLELGLDTPAHADVRDFWAALLGYGQSRAYDEELVDPGGTRPTLWFQEAPAATGEAQQRFHLDLRVPPEVAPDRVRAALEAGGTLVSDEVAPRFWVLADRHGNRACVTTGAGRDGSHP